MSIEQPQTKYYVMHTPEGSIIQHGYGNELEHRPGLITLELSEDAFKNLAPLDRVVAGALVHANAAAAEQDRLNRLWQQVRVIRDSRLQATDWRVTRAMESGEALSPAWQAYRQALRDVTSQPDPEAIEWPAVPV